MAQQALRLGRSPGLDELVQHRRGDPQAGPQVHRIQGSDPDLQPIQIPENPPRISDADRKRYQDREEPGGVSPF
jgi:hypothetical protein